MRTEAQQLFNVTTDSSCMAIRCVL